MSQIFNFGGLLDAIDPGNTKQWTYSQPTQDAINQFAPTLTQHGQQNQADIANTRTAALRAAGVLQGLEPQNLANAQTAISRYLSFDPNANYANIRAGNIAALGDLSGILGSAGRRQSSLDAARLGLGGGRNSAYQDILQQGRVNSAIAPIASGIFNNLGADSTSMNAAQLQALAAVIPALQARNSLVGTDVPYYAMPIALRDQTDANMVANLLGLGNAARTNTAGFEYQPSQAAKIGGALDTSLNSAVDTYLALYGMGGMGGGGSGGAGASGGGGSIMSLFGGGGGGGGGGNISSAQLMQLLSEMGYGGGRQAAPVVYPNPYAASQGFG